MEFSFTDLTDTGATIALSWADRRYPLPVAVATPEVVLEHARAEIAAGQDSVTWEILRQAAGYAYRQDVNLAEALSWTERSLAVRQTLPGLSLKADILARTGKTDAAAAAVNEAVAGATEADMISYARQLRRDGRADRALELLLKFSERTDDSWMTNRALGETYEAIDDPVSAKKQYEVALENAPEGKERERIRELITNLGAK
jgi:tetratricopeptide (TPR) repeat protein